MKKLLALTITLCLSFVKIFANQVNIENLNSYNIEVSGNIINNKNYQEVITGVSGMNSIILKEEKTEFSAKNFNENDNNLRVIVIPMNETENIAYKWLEDLLHKSNITGKGIYLDFYRDNTQVLPKEEIEITMELENDFQNQDLKVYYINENYEFIEVFSIVENNTIKFKISKPRYYIISKAESSIVTTPSSGLDNIIDSLKTGDDFSEQIVYIVSSLISGSMLLFLSMKRKNRKCN